MPNARLDPPAPQGRPTVKPLVRRAVGLCALTLLCATLLAPALVHAGSTAKVVVIVGPVAGLNAYYKAEAREIIAEARRYSTNVVAVFTPRATWERVKSVSRSASVLVYFGHGWGFPSRYAPFDSDRMNGMALDPPGGGDGRRRVYYGETRVRSSIRLAPGAAVLLYRLCYASGNTEPRLSEGTLSQSKRRVDGFGAGFLDTGAAIVIASGHPSSPRNYIRQLFTTDRSMLTMFRSAPDYHRHERGPYASARTPGSMYVMDPDRGGADPSGFYRSIVGDLELRTTQVTRRAPYPAPEPTATPSPSLEPTPPPTAEPTPSLEPPPTAEPTPSLEPAPEPSSP